MGMKSAGADLAFDSGLFNGTRYLGAHSAEGTELTGSAYARISVVLADWSADGRNYRVTGAENFPEPTAAWLGITHWALYSAATSGVRYLTYPNGGDMDAADIGASVGFDANSIGWGFTGKVTQAGSLKCCNEGLLAGTRYLTIHTAEPSDTGSNRIDDPIQVSSSQWTKDSPSGMRRVRNNAELSFGIAATDLAMPAWVALRDGNGNNAAVLWKDQFDVTADDPSIGDALSFPVNSLAITMAIDT